MSTKKQSSKEPAPQSAKASPMEFETVHLVPRIVAGGYGKSEADVPGLGPADESTTDTEER